MAREQLRSPNWASVLKDDEVIVISVMGDAGVGKTSLVRVFTSEVFTEEDTPGSVVEPAILQRSEERLYALHVRDTPSFLANNVDRLHHELDLAHVVILCYAVNQPASLQRLEHYWLPQIVSFRKRLPVLVVATKSDLDSVHPGDGDETAAVEAILAETDSLLTKFPNVERVMRCSAKHALEEVRAVFNQATHMVMYPIAPLLDEATDSLTPACDIALTRIFRIFDQKQRNLLGPAELSAFQARTFGLMLAQHEMTSIVDVMRHENPDAVVVDPSGSFGVTESGFKRLITMFIQENVPESAWSVLKSFNYDKNLNLQVPVFKLPAHKPDQSAILSPDAEAFLEGLFDLFARSEQALTSAHLSAMFRIVPGGAHPFGSRFPYNTRCSPTGALYRDSWMQLWSMAALVDPQAVMSSLYCLGFGLKFDLDASKALAIGPARKTDLHCMSKQRRCFVLGSAGSGKSTIIQQFLNKSLRVDIPATTEPTHYVKRPPQSSKAELEASGVSDEVIARRPSTLVITEYPAADMGVAMEDAKWQCDVCVIVVDPASDESLAYCDAVLDNIPDDVPTIVVSCAHAVSPAGATRLKARCDDVAVDLLEVNPRSADSHVSEVFQFAAMLAPTPAMNNPQTVARRAEIAAAKRWANVKLVGGAVVVAALAGVLVWLGSRRAHGKPSITANVTTTRPASSTV